MNAHAGFPAKSWVDGGGTPVAYRSLIGVNLNRSVTTAVDVRDHTHSP